MFLVLLSLLKIITFFNRIFTVFNYEIKKKYISIFSVGGIFQ